MRWRRRRKQIISKVVMDTRKPNEYYESEVRLDCNTCPTQRYTRVARIGHGTYGHVHRSIDHERNTEVAIKYIDFPCDMNDYQRVIREIHCLRHLSHTNLLGLADGCGIFCEGNEIGLVTPLHDLTLHRVLHRYCVKLMPCQRSFILDGLLAGLQYMHRSGLYHRDVKPDNVLLNKDCHPVLADFGLAREVGGSSDNLSWYVVTRWYRAPELLYKVEYDGSVDVWALGCVLAEMISGKPLFQGINDVEQLQLIYRMLGSSCESTTITSFDEFCRGCARSCRARLSMRLFDATSEELDWLECILAARRPSSIELGGGQGGELPRAKPLVMQESTRGLQEHLLFEIDWFSAP